MYSISRPGWHRRRSAAGHGDGSTTANFEAHLNSCVGSGRCIVTEQSTSRETFSPGTRPAAAGCARNYAIRSRSMRAARHRSHSVARSRAYLEGPGEALPNNSRGCVYFLVLLSHVRDRFIARLHMFASGVVSPICDRNPFHDLRVLGPYCKSDSTEVEYEASQSSDTRCGVWRWRISLFDCERFSSNCV
jgi:hypothetical protein